MHNTELALPVYFVDNDALEADETFTIVLDHTIFKDNIILAPHEAVVTIFNDDSKLYNVYIVHALCCLAIAFMVEISNASIQEGAESNVCIRKNASSEIGEGYIITVSADAVDGTGKIIVVCGN